MKQLSAIFLVLAMVLALTACGKDDDRNNGGSPNRPDTNQSQNAPQDNGSGAERSATFRQILENGYVHDSDGFLNDGENTSW